jgi:hypothetical protein
MMPASAEAANDVRAVPNNHQAALAAIFWVSIACCWACCLIALKRFCTSYGFHLNKLKFIRYYASVKVASILQLIVVGVRATR